MLFSHRHKDLVLLLVVFVLTGCVTVPPTYRAIPDWNEKKKSIRTVVIIPDKIEVYEISAGGVTEKMVEWSSLAKNNVVSAIAKELQEKHGVKVKIYSEDGLSKEAAANLKETRALFETVNATIIGYTYPGPNEKQVAFPEKIANFDYTLGKEVKDLNTEHADALLMVWGGDYTFTTGTKVRQAVGALLGGVMLRPTYMSMALIDPDTGSILWYEYTLRASSFGGTDLREADSAAGMVEQILSDMPGELDNHGKAK